MLSETMLNALNRQINEELYSAYLYFSMSSYFETLNLKGFANWMYIQSQEEKSHAEKIYRYILDKGGVPEMLAIEKPPVKWSSPQEVFEQAYAHEQEVTRMINNLVDITISEKDHATNNMLQWFVAEQVEEEATASEITEKLKLVGADNNTLLMLDKELSQRQVEEEKA